MRAPFSYGVSMSMRHHSERAARFLCLIQSLPHKYSLYEGAVQLRSLYEYEAPFRESRTVPVFDSVTTAQIQSL